MEAWPTLQVKMQMTTWVSGVNPNRGSYQKWFFFRTFVLLSNKFPKFKEYKRNSGLLMLPSVTSHNLNVMLHADRTGKKKRHHSMLTRWLYYWIMITMTWDHNSATLSVTQLWSLNIIYPWEKKENWLCQGYRESVM